jgi:hypothetical protein
MKLQINKSRSAIEIQFNSKVPGYIQQLIFMTTKQGHTNRFFSYTGAILHLLFIRIENSFIQK